MAKQIPWAAVCVLVFATAALFAATVQVARANHYHTSGYCNSPHGFVHGGSTTDHVWHSKIEINTCPNTLKQCSTGSDGLSQPWSTDSSYSSTCFASVSTGGGTYDESFGHADTSYEVVFSSHRHKAH